MFLILIRYWYLTHSQRSWEVEESIRILDFADILLLIYYGYKKIMNTITLIQNFPISVYLYKRYPYMDMINKII